jgi:uncharacterized membrane protein
MTDTLEFSMLVCAISFALIALGEFWSQKEGSRKRGYFCAGILFIVVILLTTIMRIGPIIYGTP